MNSRFRSFFMGGFECSSHRRRDGRRLDVIEATQHDAAAYEDYRQLQDIGLITVRDGIRWHRVEARRGLYEWESFDSMLHASRMAGSQVIWDLMHYGWPDWISPWEPSFVEAFANFAEAAAKRIGPGGYYVPVNEISFLAWAGGDVGYLNPYGNGRGDDLKHILCRAAIAAIQRIRAVDQWATIVSAEPLIKIHAPDGASEALRLQATMHNEAQYHALDCILGRRHPNLGGREDFVDVVGINYYPYNQWIDGATPLKPGDPHQTPLRVLLLENWVRFRRPMIIAETGCEGDERPAWLHYMMREVRACEAGGAQVEGLCLYPILDHPGWDDDRECPNGLLSGFRGAPRPAYSPLLHALERELALRESRSTIGKSGQLIST